MRKTGGNSGRERRIRGHASCLVKKQTEEAQRKREEVKKTWGWSGEAAKREKYRGRERRFKKMWRVKMSLAHAMKDVATLNKTIEQHCTRVRCASTIFTNRGENVQNAASLYESNTI